MNYFALSSDGDLCNLGNHGDWESAENTATDLLINQIWVFNEIQAKSWANFINTTLEATK